MHSLGSKSIFFLANYGTKALESLEQSGKLFEFPDKFSHTQIFICFQINLKTQMHMSWDTTAKFEYGEIQCFD